MINLKEYIESGIIEDYVLGDISEKDRQEVECLAQTHPEIAAEIQSYRKSLAIFAELSEEVKPDPKMEDRIWAAVTEDDNKKSTVIPLSPKSGNGKFQSLTKYATVAALALVSLVSIVWAFSINSELKEKQNTLASVEKSNKELRSDYNEIKDKYNKLNKIYSIPNAKIVKLTGLPNKAPNSLAYAIWDKDKGTVYLDIKELPKNPEGKQYQLWSMISTGYPLSVGVFDAHGEKQIKNIGKTNTSIKFAVTLEKSGGAEKPTLSQTYINGTVY